MSNSTDKLMVSRPRPVRESAPVDRQQQPFLFGSDYGLDAAANASEQAGFFASGTGTNILGLTFEF